MMRHSPRRANGWTIFLALLLSAGLCVQPLLAQDQAPPNYSPEQLNRMVSRIALYPDPLLAQILTAATFPDQIPDAAKWADEHHYLSGQDLANAITGDQLSWDPSVQALLPFPSVLDMMASDMDWTTDLGNAVLAQRPDVMDAVQSERHKARDYGYLRSNAQIVVSGGSYIQIIAGESGFHRRAGVRSADCFRAAAARDFSSAEQSHSDSESESARGSGRGAGAAAGSCGEATHCSSIMRAGDATGGTGAFTFIRTREFIGMRGARASSTTS